MRKIRPLFLLPLLSAVLVTSCIVPAGPGRGLGGGFRIYSALPHGYVGGAYFHGGRYYSGGRYETGAFRDQGRSYHDRYYYSGRYYYGGRFENHAAPGHQPSAGRVDGRGNRDQGMNRGPASSGPASRGPAIPGSANRGPQSGPPRPF